MSLSFPTLDKVLFHWNEGIARREEVYYSPVGFQALLGTLRDEEVLSNPSGLGYAKTKATLLYKDGQQVTVRFDITADWRSASLAEMMRFLRAEKVIL